MAKKRKKYKKRRTAKSTRRLIYSDDWGAVEEFKVWRDMRPGKKGRFVKVKSVKRLKKYPPIFDLYQYRIDALGKRSEKISVKTAKKVTRITIPGRVEVYDGNVWKAIQDSGLFNNIHLYDSALVHITGKDEDRRIKRFQVEVKQFGKDNQDLQLAWAIINHLDNQGFGSEYNLKLVKRVGLKAAEETANVTGLSDVQLTVTLR